MNDTLRQKLADLAGQRAGLLDQAEKALEAGNQADYDAAMEKVKNSNKQMEDLQALIREQEKEAMKIPEDMRKTPEAGGAQAGYERAVQDLAQAARNGFPGVMNAAGDMMQEGVDADGGYTVPPDIVTKIIQLRDSKESLRDLVTVNKVATLTGRRTIQKRSQGAPFYTVEEAAKIGKLASPQFSVLSYTVKTRGGYLPVTNQLLADSDNSIAAVVMDWLARSDRATSNKLIWDMIQTKTPTDLTDLDGILAAWVGLGSVFRATSQLVTNDDGLLYLGTLKDKNERYLLTPNPADPKQLRLCVGPYTLPVKTFDNQTIPSTAGKIPMVLGDLKEGVVLWDRQVMSVLASNTAAAGTVNAFEQNLTLWRGLVRNDCTLWDDEAFVNGYITAPWAGTLGTLTVTSAAGTASGSTHITVSPAKATGNLYKYKAAAAATEVTYGQNVQTWQAWDGSADITATSGQVITVVEADSGYKALKAGSATVVSKV